MKEVHFRADSDKNTSSDKQTSGKPKESNRCEYAPCRCRNTHEMADCRLAQSHVEFATKYNP